MLKKSLIAAARGKAEDYQIYRGEGFRITVLTPRMIRVERDVNNVFTDLPSMAFMFRSMPECSFKAEKNSNKIEIKTESVSFTLSALTLKPISVVFLGSGKKVTNFKRGNLKGTRRTLDQTFGPVKLKDGIMSKNGVSIVDDSKSMLIGEDGMFVPRAAGTSDYYIFAYENDYRKCLEDFFKVSGEVPMIPRFALGVWWSRYRQYTQSEYEELMDRFEEENIPLTVATVDMDWHWTDINAKFGTDYKRQIGTDNPITGGWTGYSWNTDLFPDYKAFLKYLKSKNLHITLNLHPADGVRFFETQYEEMAKSLGIDPKTKEDIKFKTGDPNFWNSYFDILHKPYEKDGVDFWWIDWQQGKKSDVKGLDPLVALNHYHYLDNAEDGRIPLILSRYAGIGSHRYPLGFSGDTAISWRVLDFQPYFTVNAANCGYTWWSHDIGGHHQGGRNEELYVRWLQFGVFSPIMRLHSTSDDLLGKEPWRYSKVAFEIASDWLRLRHRMIPYLYTLDYNTHSKARALCEPMYYSYPHRGEAYRYKNQYMFGDNILVCPITSPNNQILRQGSVDAWIPPGSWTDIFTGKKYTGDKEITLFRDLTSIPVLAKAGAIIPLSADFGNSVENPKNLEIMIFAGSGSFTMFEDDSKTDYETRNVKTKFTSEFSEKTLKFVIERPNGDLTLIPEDRNYILCFKDIAGADEITVTSDGEEIDFERLDKSGECLKIRFTPKSNDSLNEVTVKGAVLSENATPKEAVIDVMSRWETANIKKSTIYRRMRKLESADDFLKAVNGSAMPKIIKKAIEENLL